MGVSTIRADAAVIALSIRITAWGRTTVVSSTYPEWRVTPHLSLEKKNTLHVLAPKGARIVVAHRNLWGHESVQLLVPTSSDGIASVVDVTKVCRSARPVVTLPNFKSLRPKFRDWYAVASVRMPKPSFHSALLRVPRTVGSDGLDPMAANESPATLFQNQFRELMKGRERHE